MNTRTRLTPQAFGFTGAAAVVTLAAALVAAGSWFQIDQGDRGVILRHGAFIRLAEPGLGFKLPFIDSVVHYSVREQRLEIPKMEAYSFDQQPANLTVSIIYRVTPDLVQSAYETYGSISTLSQRLLEPKTQAETKIVFGRFNAASAIQRRQELAEAALASLRESIGSAPVQVLGLQIESIDYSRAYVESIEKRMLAQVEIETTRQKKETAEIQAAIQVVKAKGEADARREEFNAEADGIRVRGEAEATAIEARARALAANTNLVNLIAAEKWNGTLPTTMVPGSAVPFVSITK